MIDLFANLPATLLLLSTLCIGIVAMMAQSLPPFPGRGAFVAMLVSASLWTACVAFEYLEISIPGKMRVAELTWAAIILTPGFWSLFSWQYVKGDARHSVPRLWLIGQGTMVSLALIIGLTNDYHHLLYTGASPIGETLGAPLTYTHGGWYFVAVTYTYALMVTSLLLMIGGIRRSSGAYRWQYVGLTSAALLPWFANFGYVTGTFAPAGLDTAPISFLFMGLLFYLLIRRRQLFNLVPMARSALIDAVADPMLVVDRDGIVIDINGAALSLAPGSGPVAGRPLRDFPAFGPLQSLLDGDYEPVLILGAPSRRFRPTVTPLIVEERPAGRMVILRPERNT
ncbi:MAG TPA: histidine kinase N-terminal 7TM domain-containing protein [Magnetospirillaceae bacterium]|nr:histidine kinase N-terminal 7TM domain-containing protein [Magnetospirillaceae bacterium]